MTWNVIFTPWAGAHVLASQCVSVGQVLLALPYDFISLNLLTTYNLEKDQKCIAESDHILAINIKIKKQNISTSPIHPLCKLLLAVIVPPPGASQL